MNTALAVASRQRSALLPQVQAMPLKIAGNYPSPYGDEPPDASRGNFADQRFDPMPVDAHPAGQSPFGVHGLLGNAWEWTDTLFGPFDGFAARPFYPGYSANFFDGEHFVLKGGSPRTATRLLRRSFRNWFRPTYQHVYAGFRCVAD